VEIVIAASYSEMSRRAAALVADRVRTDPALVLGLATGRTPVGLYAELVSLYRRKGLDFSRVVTFNLDEYLGLPPDHPWAFRRYMDRHLFGHVNLDPSNIHFLKGVTTDPEEECRCYEEALRAAGGIDLQVLGIGRNGHIGFNEPGTSFECGTHVVTLKKSTLIDNFGRFDDVPKEALTMGISTIMRSREILLLASGSDKAEAVARTVGGPVTTEVPASVLQRHPRVTMILDEAAAARLRRRAARGAS
jgi:glucosamine-6-phosphate deaminase